MTNLIEQSAFKITDNPISFNWASRFRGVIVLGCQRSGTTIAARMIAHSLGAEYVDEERYGTKDLKLFKHMTVVNDNFVIHAPSMTRYTTGMSDLLVVYMLRDINEVRASMARIAWNDADERAKYPTEISKHIYDIKLHYWRKYQRPQSLYWTELNYDGLKSHPLWLSKGKRGKFESRQWEV